MPVTHVRAAADIRQKLTDIKVANHPHLEQALIALEFVDSKPFIKDKVNLGKVSRFSKATQLWFSQDAQYNFLISVCADVWYGILKETQREALLDLHLTRCGVAYEPETVVINGKKTTVKDEFGRVEYTDQIKTDDEGRPVWKLSPLDIGVITSNIRRYGLWYDDLLELKDAIKLSEAE